MSKLKKFKTYEGHVVPDQPEGSGFPIHLFTYEGSKGEPVYNRRWQPAAAVTALGISAGLTSFLSPTWKQSEQMIQHGLTGLFVAATLGGVALLVTRKPVITAQQLIYFDGKMLIVDHLNGKEPEAFKVSDSRLELVDANGIAYDDGQFLRLSQGTSKTYIGPFLEPSVLPLVKQRLEQGFAVFAQYYYERQAEREQRRSRRAPRPPKPDADYA